MQIATIVGARPQFVKTAVVSRALRDRDDLREILIHTGQHYDPNMSGVFFEELEIPEPDFNLGIGSGPHGAQTGQMLGAIEQVLSQARPDWVLVFGDTNSTLAGALAAVKLHIPVAHVEAGLRSFNRQMPEEINRILTDHASDLLFAPTETATANLLHEGIPPAKVHNVGDVMYDAALYYQGKASARSRILAKLQLTARQYILATIHRAENTDSPARLQAILEALGRVADQFRVVMPIHPRTIALLESSPDLAARLGQVTVIDPVGYLDMVQLEAGARVIVTDSGGVQKEAYFHKVPCATLRDETEWVELVETGWNRIIPPVDAESVYAGIMSRVDAQGADKQLYGDGHAAEQIVRHLTAS